ncbi:MAG: dNTP triphosphohydrolase [Minwuia sp.]|nr:dNTP triphosphohydrolase [Minwuia sp.]
MMDWRKLLSARRLVDVAPEPYDVARSPFQKDFDRIVFCSAFRRLQDKTQVHPLSDNDYVRTRLTHSLEVASVGRSLGAGIGQVIAGRRRLPAELDAAEFGHIVSAASLAHDIGNPPFGHRGEKLMRSWFRDAARGRAMLNGLTEAEQQDLLQFEGNAQGFRILTRLQNWRDAGGLRLTAATLATFSKYPRLVNGAPARGADDAGAQKFGIMQAEAAIFRDVARETGLQGAGEGRWLRHPLAFLVEAADDICYTIIDLEDGYKIGKIPFAEAEQLLLALGGTRRRLKEIAEPARRIAYLRAKAIGVLIGQVAAMFLDVEPQLLDGRHRAPLLNDVPGAAALAHITDVTARKVFVSDGDYERDLGADRVIRALLDRAASQSATGTSAYARALGVTDLVSGMTDSYAMQQYAASDLSRGSFRG